MCCNSVQFNILTKIIQYIFVALCTPHFYCMKKFTCMKQQIVGTALKQCTSKHFKDEQYIYIYICVFVCVCHRHGKGKKRDDEVWSFCNNRGFWCGCQQMHRQTMVVPMCMHNGFPTGKMEQMIMTLLCDVMRISHAKKGGSYIKRAWLNLGAVVTVIWVFQYKAFGLASKLQTLHLGCLGALWGGSITRMNFATIYPYAYIQTFLGDFQLVQLQLLMTTR